MKLVMVAGGSVDEELLTEICGNKDAAFLGIDEGVLRLEAAGVTPEYVIGDFDSVPEEEKNRISRTYPDRRILNPVKDDTDMEAAVRRVLEMDPLPEEVLILGATGGRMDHLLANLRLLVLFAEKRIPAFILDRQNRIRILTETTVIRKEEMYGRYISLLPVTEAVEGLSLRGFRYPLDHARLDVVSSLGISNELSGAEGEIRFDRGMIYMMETKDRE